MQSVAAAVLARAQKEEGGVQEEALSFCWASFAGAALVQGALLQLVAVVPGWRLEEGQREEKVGGVVCLLLFCLGASRSVARRPASRS